MHGSKKMCIILVAIVVVQAGFCFYYRNKAAQLEYINTVIESMNYRTCYDISSAFSRGEYDDSFVKNLGALEAYSSLSKNWYWDIFPSWLSGFASEERFSSLKSDDCKYIAETIRELISNLPIEYDVAYEKLFLYVYELGGTRGAPPLIE